MRRFGGPLKGGMELWQAVYFEAQWWSLVRILHIGLTRGEYIKAWRDDFNKMYDYVDWEAKKIC